jgi:hypothetical protein
MIYLAKSDVHPVHKFKPWQVWPGSYDNPPADGNYPFPGSKLKINRNTRIASMGSCFAREIKNVLIKKGFSYITEETSHPASKHASAAWERTYNLFSMSQIFSYTFDNWQPKVRWWHLPSGKVQDPYRRIIIYASEEEGEKDFENHKKCSFNAITKAELFIITLGLTEIWEDKKDGSVLCLPSGPYVNEGGDMTGYRFRTTGYEENLGELEKIYRFMEIHNPLCNIIITVSPVHLWATFREDIDVISAGCNSKAILRTVANEFVTRHENVYYFPSYEMATIYQPIIGKSYFSEGRENFHVNEETVSFIMKQFFRFYSEESVEE